MEPIVVTVLCIDQAMGKCAAILASDPKQCASGANEAEAIVALLKQSNALQVICHDTTGAPVADDLSAGSTEEAKTTGLTFKEAEAFMYQGKYVRRQVWKEARLSLDHALRPAWGLQIRTGNGQWSSAVAWPQLNQSILATVRGELAATDWMVTE